MEKPQLGGYTSWEEFTSFSRLSPSCWHPSFGCAHLWRCPGHIPLSAVALLRQATSAPDTDQVFWVTRAHLPICPFSLHSAFSLPNIQTSRYSYRGQKSISQEWLVLQKEPRNREAPSQAPQTGQSHPPCMAQGSWPAGTALSPVAFPASESERGNKRHFRRRHRLCPPASTLVWPLLYQEAAELRGIAAWHPMSIPGRSGT